LKTSSLEETDGKIRITEKGGKTRAIPIVAVATPKTPATHPPVARKPTMEL
jgi:hypothetical protein